MKMKKNWKSLITTMLILMNIIAKNATNKTRTSMYEKMISINIYPKRKEMTGWLKKTWNQLGKDPPDEWVHRYVGNQKWLHQFQLSTSKAGISRPFRYFRSMNYFFSTLFLEASLLVIKFDHTFFKYPFKVSNEKENYLFALTATNNPQPLEDGLSQARL